MYKMKYILYNYKILPNYIIKMQHFKLFDNIHTFHDRFGTMTSEFVPRRLVFHGKINIHMNW